MLLAVLGSLLYTSTMLTGQCVDTVSNYSQFLSNSFLCDTVVVSDERVGGVFVRNDQVNSVNYGYTLRSADNKYYSRVREPNIVKPEWWRKSNEFESNPLQYAFLHSTASDTVVLESGKEYLIDSKINVYAGNTLNGRGATIKRSDCRYTYLSHIAFARDSIIRVEDSSQFQVGQQIVITHTTSVNSGLSTKDNSLAFNNERQKIIAIQGDSLILSRGIFLPSSGVLEQWPQGSAVFTVTPLLVASGSDSVSIYNTHFDGNVKGNNFSYDWRLNDCLSLGGSTGNLVDGCSFVNVPGECILVSTGSQIINCKSDSLYGSFVHVSNVVGEDEVLIKNCEMSNSCLAGVELSGHNEGAITFSRGVINLTIDSCRFLGGAEGVMGLMLKDDWNVTMKNCQASNFKSILQTGTMTGDVVGIELRNNTFVDCGNFETQNFDTENRTKGIILENNYFENSRFDFVGVEDALILNNEFVNTDNSLIMNFRTDNSLFSICNNYFRTSINTIEMDSIDADSQVELYNNIFEVNDIDLLSVSHFGNYISANTISIDSSFNTILDTFVNESFRNFILEQDCNTVIDFDNDGYLFYEDCNDFDASINPGAVEIFDNDVDENCDQIIGSISNENFELDITIFPVPTNKWLNISSNDHTIGNYKILNVSGIVLDEGVLLSRSDRIDVGNYPSGIYYFCVTDKFGVSTQNFIFVNEK